jgi:Putative peptidoglycan binding domain
LREIAAASDFDFVAAEPRRAKSAAPKRGKGKKKPVRAALSWLAALRRFGTPFLAVVALIGLLAAVAVNAMYLQHGRHPAPLFGATFKIETPKPPPRPAHLDFLLGEKLPSRTPAPASATDAAFVPAPSVTAREVAPGVAAPVAPPVAPAATAPAAKPIIAPAHAKPATAPAHAKPVVAPAHKDRDAIGSLIGGGKTAPSVAKNVVNKKVVKKPAHAAAPAVAPAPAKSMLTTQRALEKVGLLINPDGHYDVATRKAIETFQQKNNLPVTGELTATTRHLLAARSGLHVQ